MHTKHICVFSLGIFLPYFFLHFILNNTKIPQSRSKKKPEAKRVEKLEWAWWRKNFREAQRTWKYQNFRISLLTVIWYDLWPSSRIYPIFSSNIYKMILIIAFGSIIKITWLFYRKLSEEYIYTGFVVLEAQPRPSDSVCLPAYGSCCRTLSYLSSTMAAYMLPCINSGWNLWTVSQPN